MKISIEWLKSLVAFSGTPEALGNRLTMAGLEVKKTDAETLEIEITSNRPDWLSHVGVAREVAAVDKLKFSTPVVKNKWSQDSSLTWSIQIENPTACPYYTGVYFEGVKQVPTPDFIVKRLAACGTRSISFLVDITNYVLMLTGQPLHAFDADLLTDRKIVVRNARKQEKFISLKGDALELIPEDLVIADAQKAVALAGVMGGGNSEIRPTTKNIFLESAFFQPRSVRKTALRTGLRSDSSYRFERRVDPEGVDWARALAAELIIQYAKPEKISKVFKAGKIPKSFSATISLTASEIQEALGVKIPMSVSAGILKRLGLTVQSTERKLSAKIPSFRADLTRPIDLIEEIARVYGYDRIPESMPSYRPLPETSKFRTLYQVIEQTRDFFAHHGFYDAVTFSLVGEAGSLSPAASCEPVILRNPQNTEWNQMRRTFLHSLLRAAALNYDRQADGVAFFEIANTYTQKSSKPVEEKKLALLLSGVFRPSSWIEPGRQASFHDLKGILSAWLQPRCGTDTIQWVRKDIPGLVAATSLEIQIENRAIGFLGEVAPELLKTQGIEAPTFYAEIKLAEVAAHLKGIQTFRELPKYPAIRRDLAVVVPESVRAEALAQSIKQEAGELASAVELFDLFRGGRIPKGFKNLGFRVTYQSPDRTLLSDDIQALHSRAARKIQEKFQATFQ